MYKHLPTVAVSLLLTAAVAVPTVSLFASTKPASIVYAGKTYYRVLSTNKAQNTGNKVCALVGKTCIGYTATGNNDICMALHPKAKSVIATSGGKSGFYCNGKPQKGVCEKAKNTCAVCPTCTLQATCTTDISIDSREMYVECGPLGQPATTSSNSSKGLLKSSSSSSQKKSSSSSSVRSVKSSSSSSVKSSKPSTQIGPFPGKIACDFYQTGKNKIAKCNNPNAANAFCVTAMKSPLAKAAECTENGRIICVRPCVANPAQTSLTQCAYDPERRSGYQRKPYDFCIR
ncbi:MAG: hypothetical protein PHZ00_07330 [Candidatus Peribacteraceae bacterium]|nr:hypothetical protein [Candidatus Peribacteraceae bacterium]